MAKSYVGTYGFATIYCMQCTYVKAEITQSPHLQHLFTLSVTLYVQNFVANGPRLTKVQKKTKNTDGPKFTDSRMVAVSSYFKRSMVNNQRL